jgi:polysaccharide pyruvyl transferase WcaK-like protein
MVNENRRLAIVTLHGYHNYGNKLQNYALQEVLNELGFITDTLILSTQSTPFKAIYDKAKKIFRQSPLESVAMIRKRVKPKVISKEHGELVDSRTNVFKQFSKHHLSEKFVKLDKGNIATINKDYDYFVTGSDQVWNPVYISNMEKYFLTFADKSKRIAYAPSFSCPKLPKSYEKKYRKWLKEMSKLSVREQEGAEIIKELTGIDAPVLVDPTLLLSKKQWLSIANKAINRPEEGYILTYFLGEISTDTEQYIQNLAQEKNMKIIRLGDIRDKESYVTGPREFIDYINHADILFTDSFHGAVFSILLETPFVVYERKTNIPTMYSRIETLLDKFDLRHREADNVGGDIFATDYSHVYEILEAEKNRSFKYLSEALGIGDEKTHES